jgi:hypothetical protein
MTGGFDDTNPLWKYAANVQFGVGTPINPSMPPATPAVKGYQFIERFAAKDTAPITVVDAASQAARDQQVIRITKGIVGDVVEFATDEQILNLHRDYMAGRYG